MLTLTRSQMIALVVVGAIILAVILIFIILGATGITIGGSGGLAGVQVERLLMTNTPYILFSDFLDPAETGKNLYCITSAGTTNFVTPNALVLDTRRTCEKSFRSNIIFNKVDEDGNIITGESEPVRYSVDKVVVRLVGNEIPPQYIHVSPGTNNVVVDNDTAKIALVGNILGATQFIVTDSTGSNTTTGQNVIRTGNDGFQLLRTSDGFPAALSLAFCRNNQNQQVSGPGCGVINSDADILTSATFNMAVFALGPQSAQQSGWYSRFHAYRSTEL